MSFKHIQTLSMNPHFYGVLMQSFLSGYEKPCEIRLFFMALPILLYSESRQKLISANNRSKMETLFNTSQELDKNIKISGKIRLSGYINRFDELKEFSKKALIILYSNKEIVVKEQKILLLKQVKYSDYNNNLRNWLRACYVSMIYRQ